MNEKWELYHQFECRHGVGVGALRCGHFVCCEQYLSGGNEANKKKLQKTERGEKLLQCTLPAPVVASHRTVAAFACAFVAIAIVLSFVGFYCHSARFCVCCRSALKLAITDSPIQISIIHFAYLSTGIYHSCSRIGLMIHSFHNTLWECENRKSSSSNSGRFGAEIRRVWPHPQLQSLALRFLGSYGCGYIRLVEQKKINRREAHRLNGFGEHLKSFWTSRRLSERKWWKMPG